MTCGSNYGVYKSSISLCWSYFPMSLLYWILLYSSLWMRIQESTSRHKSEKILILAYQCQCTPKFSVSNNNMCLLIPGHILVIVKTAVSLGVELHMLLPDHSWRRSTPIKTSVATINKTRLGKNIQLLLIKTACQTTIRWRFRQSCTCKTSLYGITNLR